MSSSECILIELDKKCNGDHEHVQLVGGRAAGAQVYPEKLCEAICKGLIKQKNKDKLNRVTTGRMTEGELKGFVNSLCSLQSVKSGIQRISSIQTNGGITRPVGKYPEHWMDTWHEPEGGFDVRGVRPQYGVTILESEMSALTCKGGYEVAFDDVSNAQLEPSLVKAARALEMEYFKKLGVYEVVPREHQHATGGKIIGVRWVDVNKGDATETNYRSRLVGREFNIGRDDALYAATPPLEALRLVISHAATHQSDGVRRMVMINDVRRAYFYAKIQRDVYVELPKEDEDFGTGKLGKLKLCLYGTRDAAKGWQETLSAHLEKIGFRRGRGHPCVFYHPERDIKTLVHGDDYVSAGSSEAMAWMESELEKAYEIQTQKLSDAQDCKTEGKVLNRIVRHTSEGWEIEADPRHAELVIEQLGLEHDKGVVTPGVSGGDEDDNDEDTALIGEDVTRFRGVIARCNYLSTDRPDCLFAVKEGCREMSSPTTGSLRRLRRIGRYLKKHPRLVWKYAMQSEQTEMTIRTDADWAGCRRSRKSTSGGTASLGGHCIKVWAKTQAVIAKSSAESELYGVVRGACEGLGLRTLCADLGGDVEVKLELDATAAKGILDRQGLAKVRHLDVNCLWLQEQCSKKMVPLIKIPGEINTADLMTKHLVSPMIMRHVKNLNLDLREGRSEKAAKLHSITRSARQAKADTKRDVAMCSFNRLSGEDFWSERGEYGRWVRTHVVPRLSMFCPWKATRGPGRKTKLDPVRSIRGVYSNGEEFKIQDDWMSSDEKRRMHLPWTGQTIFIVDRKHSTEFGTDQRRQRALVSNVKKVSWKGSSDEQD